MAIGIAQSQPEIAIAIEEGGLDYSVYFGPIWIKVLKDVFMFGLWGYLVLRVPDPFPATIRRAIRWCYAIALTAFMLSALQLGPLLALAGLRWIAAVFVFLELRRLVGARVDVTFMTQVLIVLLLVNFGLQILRLAYFPPLWGERWGLPARVPGFFLLPNTNALFATACAALVIDMKGRRHGLALLALLLASLSTALSQSAGGMLGCFVLLAYVLVRRLSRVLPMTLIVGGLLLSVAPDLLGRENVLSTSGGERIEKLMWAVGELAGPGVFGAYTNAGFMLILSDSVRGTGDLEPVVSDSFYVSLMGNLGLFCLPFIYFFVRALRRGSRHIERTGRQLGSASLLCLATFAFSTVISEAFPMAVMLSIGVWMGSRSIATRKRGHPRRLSPASTWIRPATVLMPVGTNHTGGSP